MRKNLYLVKNDDNVILNFLKTTIFKMQLFTHERIKEFRNFVNAIS